MFKFEDIFRLYTKKCVNDECDCIGCKLVDVCDIYVDRYLERLAEKYYK